MPFSSHHGPGVDANATHGALLVAARESVTVIVKIDNSFRSGVDIGWGRPIAPPNEEISHYMMVQRIPLFINMHYYN